MAHSARFLYKSIDFIFLICYNMNIIPKKYNEIWGFINESVKKFDKWYISIIFMYG